MTIGSHLRPLRGVALAAVAGIALAACTSSGSGSDGSSTTTEGATAIDMAFEWTCSGDWAVVYAGEQQGIFADNGIDLTYTRGQGGSSTTPLVAAGEFDMGILSAPPVIIGAGEGLPITMVGAAATESPVTILADSSIKTPKDLEGKSLAVQTDQFEGAVWKAFVAATGIDESKVKVIPSDDAAQAQFLAGDIDALVTFYPTASTEGFLTGRPGLNVIRMQDYVPTYGHTFVFNNSFLSDHGDAAKSFVTAWAESAKYAIANRDESLKLLESKCPELDPAAAEFSLDAYFAEYDRPYSREHGFGSFDLEGVAATQKVLVDGGLTEGVPVDKFATLEYLPDPAVKS
jgi:ABC-type nitrate/sulfonate/bicarbonate transport system substrate-binding protein